MCLDIAFYSALELIDDYFPDLVQNEEIAFDLDMGVHVMAMGYKRYPIIVFENGRYIRKFFEWCIIPEYLNTPEKVKAGRPKMANARSEKLLDKKSFWYRIRQQRCLIPVTGIYEHREVKAWKNKIAYHVQMKDRKLFCVPGLFHFNRSVPSDPETGEMRGMFSMETTAANDVMRMIHNSGDNAFRMPLFLPKELELKWLEPGLSDNDINQIIDFQMPSEELSYYPVASIRGRTVRADGKRKNEPFEHANLPPLGIDDCGMEAQSELFS